MPLLNEEWHHTALDALPFFFVGSKKAFLKFAYKLFLKGLKNVAYKEADIGALPFLREPSPSSHLASLVDVAGEWSW